jgi:hypothetical protein
MKGIDVKIRKKVKPEQFTFPRMAVHIDDSIHVFKSPLHSVIIHQGYGDLEIGTVIHWDSDEGLNSNEFNVLESGDYIILTQTAGED